MPELALLACRLLLAAVFLLAGATKLVDPVGFRKALRDFGLPLVLARFMLLLLPLLELAVAAALIPAGLAWYGAWGALGLLCVFLIAVAIAMARGRKPDCHCFGQLHSAPVGRSTLIRNAALAAFAGLLVWRGPAQSGPQLWAWFATLGTQERKVAIVVACAAGFLFFRLLDRSRPRPAPEPDAPPVVEHEETPQERTEPARPSAMGVGLPIGTPAPEFELPAMTGEKRTLQSLRENGRDLLLVFSSPFCEPCHALATDMVRWTREEEGLPKIVVISRGTAQDNLAKLKGFEASRVLLQREFEISEAYDCNATPTAVLVGADGLIRSPLAVGRMDIRQLVSSAKHVNS